MNATLPPESLVALPTAPLYRWEVTDKPISVYLSLELLDRLERATLEAFKAVTSRGSEIGGVLLGRTAQAAKRLVTVEGFETVECEYSRGPLFLLADADRKRLEEVLARVKAAGGLSAVGFFRSNTRRDVVLDDEDLAIAKEYFADPASVFLLAKPFAMKPSQGGFFFWENGQLRTEPSYLPFPFKRAEIEKTLAQFVMAPGDASLEIFRPKAAPAPPKVEERKPAPPAPKVEEKKVAAPPPPAPKVEERKAAPPPPPPPVARREERPPIAAPAKEAPKPSVPPAAAVAPKPAAPVAPAASAAPPRKEEKPVPPALKREERVPPAPPKPEQRPAGPVLVKKEEPKLDVPPPKPVITPISVRGGAAAAPAPIRETKEEPAAVAETVTSTVPAFGQPLAAPERGAFARLVASPWLWIAVIVVLLVAAGGYYMFVYRAAPAVQVQTASDTLGLKVERNAGQLLLSWNKAAPLIQTAERAILSINDGDHREDVELDLGQLRIGSIVYTPMTNDVSFRLEVTDIKRGKSQSESVRVLAGRPSPTTPVQQALPAQPAKLTPAVTAEPKPEPAPAKPAAESPAPAPPPAQPEVTATTAVTVQPPKPESLAARLSAPAAPPPTVLEAPTLEHGQSALPSATMPGAGRIAAAPPPPEPRAVAPQPAAQPAPARVGGLVQEARPIRREPPVYPTLARQARVAGTVRVEAVVGTDGRVKSARAVSGPALLRQAAVDAVRRWQYQPATLNGQPTETTTQIDLLFSPANR